MPYEEIHEPVEMIAFFINGSLKPLRFRWKSRVYKISKVNSSWSVQQGRGRQHHFSVSTNNSDFYELIFDCQDFTWQLARVCFEG